MDSAQIHFEVFVRRTPASGWTLELATEDRARAIETAEQLLASKQAAGVRVTKETLDPDTREYQSVTVLAKGATEQVKPKKQQVDDTPLCVAPADLYTAHAREKIGRLLEGWLKRNRVTPFELLHRPDLAEQLDASGMELQSAIQKIAIPESQATGVSVHDLIRTLQKLAERAIEKLSGDGRRKAFPQVDKGSFAAACGSLAEDPERVFRLGCGVAAYVGQGKTWSEKMERIFDLADAAPEGRGRGLAFHVLEQPLSEIVGASGAISDLAGPDLDFGGSLAFLTRLVAAPEIASLITIEPGLDKLFPALTPAADRLAKWLAREEFKNVRNALARRILTELTGPKRLRPSDPYAEIAILRALAMALTASAGRLLRAEDVHDAFVERSKSLAGADFVEAYLRNSGGALNEAPALVRLTENMVGAANKRAAARWLSSCVGALKFETEIRALPDSPAVKLTRLAELQHAVLRVGLVPEDQAGILAKIGEIGDRLEAETKLVLLIAKAQAPAPHRLNVLLKLACGETGPLGPVADRAKVQALQLLREPGLRAELASSPELLEKVKAMMGPGPGGLAA